MKIFYNYFCSFIKKSFWFFLRKKKELIIIKIFYFLIVLYICYKSEQHNIIYMIKT